MKSIFTETERNEIKKAIEICLKLIECNDVEQKTENLPLKQFDKVRFLKRDFLGRYVFGQINNFKNNGNSTEYLINSVGCAIGGYWFERNEFELFEEIIKKYE